MLYNHVTQLFSTVFNNIEAFDFTTFDLLIYTICDKINHFHKL